MWHSIQQTRTSPIDILLARPPPAQRRVFHIALGHGPVIATASVVLEYLISQNGSVLALHIAPEMGIASQIVTSTVLVRALTPAAAPVPVSATLRLADNGGTSARMTPIVRPTITRRNSRLFSAILLSPAPSLRTCWHQVPTVRIRLLQLLRQSRCCQLLRKTGCPPPMPLLPMISWKRLRLIFRIRQSAVIRREPVAIDHGPLSTTNVATVWTRPIERSSWVAMMPSCFIRFLPRI